MKPVQLISLAQKIDALVHKAAAGGHPLTASIEYRQENTVGTMRIRFKNNKLFVVYSYFPDCNLYETKKKRGRLNSSSSLHTSPSNFLRGITEYQLNSPISIRLFYKLAATDQDFSLKEALKSTPTSPSV